MADMGRRGLSEAITSGSSAVGADQDCIWPQGMQAQQKAWLVGYSNVLISRGCKEVKARDIVREESKRGHHAFIATGCS